jgi:uncharacterized protein YbaR (Trm112 family)
LNFGEDYITDLVCPIGKFALLSENNFLVCSNCGVKFPVIEGIPILLIDDAILPEGINSVSELKCRTK